MFVIEKYHDGSVSYAYETGDRVVMQRDINLHNLYGDVYTSYKVGDVVTITGRGTVGGKPLIPAMIEFYQFNNHFGNHLGSLFKPENSELALSKPLAFVVPWYEGAMQKHSLIAARTKEAAVQRCFAAKWFTPERMSKIKIGEVFERNDWKLPDNTKWISVCPLA